MKQILSNRHNIKYPYYITKNGEVWSEYSQKFISTQKDKDGYLKVRIACTDLPSGRWKTSVHRLVLETYQPFIGMENFQVNHIDGNKENNRLDNLEWVTCQQNIAHAMNNHLRAEINGSAKLTKEQVHLICKLLEEGNTNLFLGKIFNVHPDTIGRIRRKKSWTSISAQYKFN